MEPLDDRHWLEPPDELTDEEWEERDAALWEDADLWYKEKQDDQTNARH